jgi:NosR/NirI family nitrous oxide reductase transcriptional regulator
MTNSIARYARWLHTRWPAGGVEKLPEVGEDGSTSVPGVRIVGDLTGIPLLKFSADTGARAVQAIVNEPGFRPSGPGRTGGGAPAGHASGISGSGNVAGTGVDKGTGTTAGDVVDLAIIGAGVSGIAAAIEAKRSGLSYQLFEATEAFSTIVDFPKAKPIFTYPIEMVPAGELQVGAAVKEDLLEELRRQKDEHGIEVTYSHVERIERKGGELLVHHGEGRTTRARRVIVAIGRTGNYRKLGVPGEDRDKVYNRLHDPRDFAGKQVLVVGGGDSAVEASIALTCVGAHVQHCCRSRELSRPKPENLEKLEHLRQDPSFETGVERPTSERVGTAAGSRMREAPAGSVRLVAGSQVKEIREDSVVVAGDAGREETIPNDVVFTMIGREAPLGFLRRSGIRLRGEMSPASWALLAGFVLFCLVVYLWKGWLLGRTDLFAIGRGSGLAATNFLGTISLATADPGFWFTVAYTAAVVGFGIARIRRRRTPYVTAQTLTLMAIQIVPLFILPELVLPWMDANGWLPEVIRSNLFPDGQYWRSFGFVLAWPLLLVNLASPQPMLWWIVIGLVQTFVIIPLIVWRWGKGAYCGWICSCGALAETMGDRFREKMWHGPTANRFNMAGQAILAIAALITAVFMLSWIPAFHGALAPVAKLLGKSYNIVVEIVIGGAIGLGFYFWFSGRVWCRFACPLAALMHIYARFSRFRIFAEKKKCISCNVCTSVCHQGIDIMNFANKGLPMEDPECVRCSACVQSCPTGVLRFGRLGKRGEVIYDRLVASPVVTRKPVEAGPPLG